jgi:tetratricopeptide (TPR) repeat protein
MVASRQHAYLNVVIAKLFHARCVPQQGYLRAMRRAWSVILAVLLVLAAGAQQSKNELKIRKALDKDHAYKAIGYCERIFAKKDTPAVVLMLRADAYNRIGRYDDALRDARKAQQVLGDDVELRSQFIGAFLGQGLADSALHYVDKGGEVKNEEFLYRKGSTYELMQDWPKALAVFDTGVERYPGASRMWRKRGACHAMLGDSAKARVDLDMAVELAPHDAVAYNSRGFYRYAQWNEHERAIADMDMAIKQDPNYGYAFSNRGWSYYKLGNTEQAWKDLTLAAKKNPGNAYVYRNMGYIELASGDTVGACRYFGKALERNFTRFHGDEVLVLVETNCSKDPIPAPPAEVPAFPPRNAPNEIKPAPTPAPRNNAP